MIFEINRHIEIDENYQGVNLTEFSFTVTDEPNSDLLVDNFMRSKQFSYGSLRDCVKNEPEKGYLRRAFNIDRIKVTDQVGGLCRQIEINDYNLTNYKIMNRSNLFRIILLFVVVLFTSCDDKEEPSSKVPDVYVVGWKLNEQKIEVATLWKNGEEQALSDGIYETSAYSVYVSENDVYIAGYEKNSHGYHVATLWKNGEAQYLSDGTNHAEANSVSVSGNNVYVAGWALAQGRHIATLWKNGIAQNLTNNTQSAFANCVYVSGNDIYVVGYERIPDPLDYDYLIMPNLIAKLWKNGVEQNLSDGTGYDIAYSVYVLGNDVYVAGGFHTAKLWKNGIVQNLPNGTEAFSVYVAGGNVYVAGKNYSQYNDIAKLWKNGKVQGLSEETYETSASSVYVFGNDVYVAGYKRNLYGYQIAALWKNGVVQNLSDGSSTAMANCVFVK